VYYDAPAQLRYMASNLLLRDGGTTESPSYNTARLETVPIMALVRQLRNLHPERFPAQEFPVLFDHPNYRAMFGYFTDLVCIEKYLPVIGDMGSATLAKPAQTATLAYGSLGAHATVAYGQYGDAKLAQTAVFSRAVPTEPDFFADTALLDRVRQAGEAAGSHIARQTQAMDGYKLAILRDGDGEQQRALWSFYGALLTHGQPGPLEIGLMAKGLDLLPSIGYPQSWKDAGTWEGHVLTHNTVCVDRANPGGDVGRLLALVKTPWCQWLELDRERVASGVTEFRRQVLMVSLGAEDFYVVDILDVLGGGEHHLSYHGPQAPVTTSGPGPLSPGPGHACRAGDEVRRDVRGRRRAQAPRPVLPADRGATGQAGGILVG